MGKKKAIKPADNIDTVSDFIFNKKLSKELIKDPEWFKNNMESLIKRTSELDIARDRMASHFREILNIMESLYPKNLSMNDPNLVGTPDRVARAWIEMMSGLGIEENKILATKFPSDKYDQIIILKDIDYTSLCSHHILPFTGKVSIGYLPQEKEGSVCGVSKLARVVDACAKRPQLQERMADNILNALEEMKPRGAIVVVTGQHQCMGCRGIEKANASMVTSSVVGEFRDLSLKQEFFELLKIHH